MKIIAVIVNQSHGLRGGVKAQLFHLYTTNQLALKYPLTWIREQAAKGQPDAVYINKSLLMFIHPENAIQTHEIEVIE